MSDDFSATTLDREAITFDEPLEDPAPAAPVAPGPAWAGTLAEAPASPALKAEPAPPPQVAAPAPALQQPQTEPVDPTDFAATNVHHRAHDVSVEAPMDELSEHNRVLAALPGRSTDAAPSEAGDRVLVVSLVLVCSVIVLIVLALLVAGAGFLIGPE